MNTTLVLEKWIEEMTGIFFSWEEGILALYLFSETIRKTKNCKEIYKNIAAASVILSTKILRDRDYLTIWSMENIRPPYPPFLDSSSIVKAEKFILQNFDYNLINATNKCFNIENRIGVQKQLLTRV